MTIRSVVAIIFALIVAVEIYFYLDTNTPLKVIPGERIEESMFRSETKVGIDYESKQSRDNKYTIIIGATVLVGGIVTFASPNTKIK